MLAGGTVGGCPPSKGTDRDIARRECAMRWRSGRAASALVLGTALVTGVAAVPAQAASGGRTTTAATTPGGLTGTAATTPGGLTGTNALGGSADTTASASAESAGTASSGWRIDKVFGSPHFIYASGLAASGADNAWLLGLVPAPEGSFVTQRWSGSHWVSVAVPKRLQDIIGPWRLFSGAYTTSPSDTWFFPDLPHGPNTVQDAVRWDGSSWTISTITTSPDLVMDAAVYSAANVWTFGESTFQLGRYGPAVVRHWDGKTWQAVQVPAGTPVTVDGVAPDDIWALGVSKATVHAAHQVMIAMHWNGTAWSARPLPTIPPASTGHPWTATAISATGPRDAWVLETPAAGQSTASTPPGLILLHWNGSTWSTVARSHTLRGATGLTPDGHGGFWLTATAPANSNASDIIDYRDGKFTSQAAPAPSGYAGSATGIVPVPGTDSFWATGLLTPLHSGSNETDILHYTP
jgi:hypothetical protein